MLDPRLHPISDRLRCPECKSSVAASGPQGDSLLCTGCQTSYAIQNGVPILLSDRGRQRLDVELSSHTGREMVEEYRALAESPPEAEGSRRRWYDFLRPPAVMYHANPQMRAETTRGLFDHRGEQTLVLNVGGGPTRYTEVEITMNLEAFHNVDVVGDAHDAPFMDDTFDSIICNAVLEHVSEPEKAVAEMIRVLKPGGILYAEVPYIFFFHGYPNDFRRYTREGMRRLFSALDQPEIGIVIGPVSAMLQSANMLLQMFVPSRFPRLRTLANGAFRWATFVFKYLDVPLMARAESHTLAGAFYALGRKPDAGATNGSLQAGLPSSP